MKMLSRFNYIFTLGVKQEQSSTEKRDIIFTNQAIFVLLFSSFCITLANIVAGCYLRVSVPLITFFCLLSTLYFQANSKYNNAKFLAILFPFLAAILSPVLFGPLAKTQFYLGATLVLAIILFHNIKAHIKIFAVHFLGIVLLKYWIDNRFPVFENQDAANLSNFHLAFVAFCIYLTLTQFKVHYLKYENKVNELFLSVQKQSSELKLQNMQIEQQSARLIEVNKSLNREIIEKESVQQQLLNSNEELERFAYVASHDLKEPLRTIGSFTQILQKQLEPQAPPETKEYFHFVIDGVKRMSYLLEDLLALSRLNREFQMGPINLNNILEVVNLNLRNLITENEGKLIVGEMPTITGNKTQISQLFQNLISNGFKFKGEEPSLVEVSCKEIEGFYEFQIKDNGIGISKKYQEQIFIIFKRLHTRDKYEGTGIGLAICKKVIKNHSGQIWIESAEGAGTTMYFTIAKQEEDNGEKINKKVLVEAQ